MTKTVELLEKGNIGLLKYIPKGESPKLYLQLIKKHVMGVDKNGGERPDEDLLLFLYFAKRTGLDPLAKQIYAVFRWDSTQGKEKMAIQVGIDGMRLVAQRSGQYAGQDDTVFFPEDESAPHPIKATVTVYKILDGIKTGTTATARWAEYAQTKDGKAFGLWAKMPYTMLAKCAEALALRKAFPNELSGIYTEEEMGQSTNPLSDVPISEWKKKEEPQVIHGSPEDVVEDKAISDIGDKLVEARKKLAEKATNND